MSRPPLAGAVDFGGTKLMVGVVDAGGAILDHDALPTPAGGPGVVADEAARRLAGVCERLGIRLDALTGVGSTVPALADGRTGTLLYAPAHGWRDVPFARMLEERTGLSARIANDVNACVLAEARFGVGQGVDDFVWATVSTGVGSGLRLAGRLYEGSGGLAGELGHVVVDEGGALCGCGNRGCLEASAAGPAIARRAREAGLDASTGLEVSELARGGDQVARGVMEQTGVFLGRGLAAFVNCLDPALIVLGGGVARSLDLFREPLERELRSRVIMPDERRVRIVPTALGYEAALIGAATLVLPETTAVAEAV